MSGQILYLHGHSFQTKALNITDPQQMSAHPIARPDSARPRLSLPKKFANFNNSSAGLDLTLRLIQALAQIAAEVCIDSATVIRCVIAKSQLALGELIVVSCSDRSLVIRVDRSISRD